MALSWLTHRHSKWYRQTEWIALGAMSEIKTKKIRAKFQIVFINAGYFTYFTKWLLGFSSQIHQSTFMEWITTIKKDLPISKSKGETNSLKKILYNDFIDSASSHLICWLCHRRFNTSFEGSSGFHLTSDTMFLKLWMHTLFGLRFSKRCRIADRSCCNILDQYWRKPQNSSHGPRNDTFDV